MEEESIATGGNSSDSENVSSSSRGLSAEGLLRMCRMLRDSPWAGIDKAMAAQVLAKQEKGDGLAANTELNYYDFWNVMLGRKKFKVSLWMYDVSHNAAKYLSLPLLGQHFDGIWHTAVVIEWADAQTEFWFGGSLFATEPGTSPFGEPVEKRPLGHTYKLREEVISHCRETLSSEFTRAKYDVLTHNCNHFSEKLSRFLRSDRLPDKVLKQPEMVMSTVTARALRPLLNRWLGSFNEDGKEAGEGEGDGLSRVRGAAELGTIVEFSCEEGGRQLV